MNHLENLLSGDSTILLGVLVDGHLGQVKITRFGLVVVVSELVQLEFSYGRGELLMTDVTL